ncbi:ferredoxin [Sphaerisporangium sp. NPDC051011]|uniref:ferredoxin n=1 Tax=Sphaerisporangium sp. NPDC051011 TaxID=3155792 RepID=UPI0033ECD724
MKVTVNGSRCQGHNRCMILAPAAFEVDEFGYAFVPEDRQEVTEDRREAVLAAARNCPERAILVSEEEG